jgi:peptidoglycan/LPS O-acetylase OafA/YrhL
MGEFFGRSLSTNAAHSVNDTPTAVNARQATLRYLPGLDGLRAISVLAVIFFHHYFIYGTERGWLPGGFLGVEVFFVVSGYLITSLLLAERRETGMVSLRHFWLRRGRRLLPAVLVLLAVVIAYSLLFLPDSIETLKGDTLAALTYTSNWWQIAANRSYAVTAGRPELLKHLWSLAIEEQFYLLWPPLLILGLRKLGRSRMVVAMLATAILSTILLAVLSFVSINFAYYATFTRLSGLLLGGLMAFFFAPYRIRGLPGRGARIALDMAGVAGLIVLFISFRVYTFPALNTGHVDRSVFLGGFLLIDVATLFVIAAAVHPASDVGRLIGCKPLQWIGLRSYSLYLWHFPIFAVTRPRVDFDHFFHLRGWPVLLLRFVLTFGAAELSYRFVETPIRNGALGRYRERLVAAHGKHKRLLARRGLVVAGSLIVVTAVLGMGLANAQPQADKFGASESGDQPSADALAALRKVAASTTTVARATTSTTVKHGGGKASKPTRKTTTTTTTIKPGPPPAVLAIGDSVMRGSRGALLDAIPGIIVDATTSRQFGEAVALVGFYNQYGLLPNILVVHLGTNGRATDGAIDQIMSLAGSNRFVFFLTARVPRVWEKDVNDTLHRALTRFANVKVLEWRDYSGCHDDWFVNDGFHLTTVGQHAYGAFIRSGIEGHPLTVCKK